MFSINSRNEPVLRNGKQIRFVSLFPSAVLTASGSKGISQHKAPLKFFVNVKIKKLRIQG
jgi:hypothetical protein